MVEISPSGGGLEQSILSSSSNTEHVGTDHKNNKLVRLFCWFATGISKLQAAALCPQPGVNVYFVRTGYGGRLSFTGGFFFNSSITT